MTLLLNVAAYSAQLLLVIAIGFSLPWLLRITAPAVRHAYWRVLLLVALLLPWLQDRHTLEQTSTTSIVVGTAGIAGGGVELTLLRWDWSSIALAGLAAGIAGRSLWIAAGLMRLRRLRASGTAAPGRAELADAQMALGTTAEIRYVPDLAQPVTFGLLRPVVLLPADLLTAPREIERAVLYHELLHVQRRDWTWLLLEEIVRAVFWFHPAMWLLVSRVQQSREEVIDELAIMATGARRAYIEALVRFAGAAHRAPAPAFAQRQMLFRRILLLSHPRVMSSHRVAFVCLAIVAILASGSSSAVSAFPLFQFTAAVSAAPAAPRMDIVLRAPDVLVSANDSPLGPAVSSARRSRTAAGAASRRQRTTTPSTSRPSPLQTGAVVSTAVVVPAVDVERPPLRVGAAVQAPMRLKHAYPMYPPIAAAARVSGLVVIEATIDVNGRVAAATVVQSIPLLDQAALDAVRQWEFRPTLLNGLPVPIVMSLSVNFVLEP